jgi:hypothetical protein
MPCDSDTGVGKNEKKQWFTSVGRNYFYMPDLDRLKALRAGSHDL